jgi:hypothetical protein
MNIIRFLIGQIDLIMSQIKSSIMLKKKLIWDLMRCNDLIKL